MTQEPEPAPASAAAEARTRRKVVQGRVKSAKMNKTIIVQIIRFVRHAKYGKYLRRYSKFYVDDPQSQAKAGDLVDIMETRPLSKLKRWRLVRVVDHSERADEFKVSEPSIELAQAVADAPAGAAGTGAGSGAANP